MNNHINRTHPHLSGLSGVNDCNKVLSIKTKKMKKVKLSDTQKSIVKQLRTGGSLVISKYTNNAWLCGIIKVRKATMDTLLDKRIIWRDGQTKHEFNYALTRLGRTIEL